MSADSSSVRNGKRNSDELCSPHREEPKRLMVAFDGEEKNKKSDETAEGGGTPVLQDVRHLLSLDDGGPSYSFPWNEIKSMLGDVATAEGSTVSESHVLTKDQVDKIAASMFEVKKIVPSSEDSPTSMDIDDDGHIDARQGPTIDLNQQIFKSFEPMEGVELLDDAGKDDDSCDFPMSDDEMSVSDLKKGSDTVDIQALATILDSGKHNTASIGAESDVVLVIGATGVGKSTFIQTVAGHTIVTGRDESLNKPCYVLEGTGEAGFDIGSGMVSETKHVRSYFRESSSTYYVDSAGFEDTTGIETDIATSICVKEIAGRAKRLRFVVLINSYTFYLHKSAELRKNLDLVAKFVGHNFDGFKKSFTFFFTHCNEAFTGVRTLIDSQSNSEAIISADRSELCHLLNESKKGCRDASIRSLISFLRGCLENGKPYCDMFDPLYSDVDRIRSSVEPSLVSAIEDPKLHVKCSLTSTCRLALGQELSRRVNSIQSGLEELKLGNTSSETLRNDALAVCTLAANINESICSQPAQHVLRTLEESLSLDKDFLFKMLGRDCLNKKNVDVESAAKTKESIERINFVRNLRDECLIKQEGGLVEFHPGQCEQLECYKQLIAILEDWVSYCKQEIAKARPFLSDLPSSVERALRPDFHSVAVYLGYLSCWSDAFGGEIERLYEKAKASILGHLKEVVSDCVLPMLSTQSVADLPQLMRGLALFHKLRASAMLLSVVPHEVEQKFWVENQKSLLLRALEIISMFPKTLEATSVNVFSSHHPDIEDCGENRYIFCDLHRLLLVVETTDAVIREESLRNEIGSAELHKAAVAITSASYVQHCELASRLVGLLYTEERSRSLLQSCFLSLQMFLDSLPPSIAADGGFQARFSELRRLLGKELRSSVDFVRGFVGQLEVNSRLVIKGDRIRNTFRMLEDCVWYDSFLSGSVEQPYVLDAIRAAQTSCSTFTDALSESLKFSLDSILSGKGSKSMIKETCSKIKDSQRDLKVMMSIMKADSANNTLRGCHKQVEQWCLAMLGSENPIAVTNVDFDAVSAVILTARSLLKLEVEIDKHLEVLLSKIDVAFQSYTTAVWKTISSERGFHSKGEILDAASAWSKHEEFQSLLPAAESLRKEIRKQVIGGAENLHELILRADSVVLSEMQSQIDDLLQATKYLDHHLGGDASRWANTVTRTMECRNAEIEEDFRNLVDTNDFKAIKESMQKWKDSSDRREKGQYPKALKLVSISLWHTVSSIRFVLDAPGISVDGGNLRQKLNTLEQADSILVQSIGTMPPATSEQGSWCLKDEIDKLKKDAKSALEEIRLKTVDAVDGLEFSAAHSSVSHAIALQELTRSELRRRNLESINKLETIKTQVAAMIPKVVMETESFLSSLAQSTKSTTSRQWLAPGRKRGGKSSEPVFPPDVSFLYKALGNMKRDSEKSDCPTAVTECYLEMQSKLSKGINTLIQSLMEESKQGKFTRPLKVLGFLRDELDSRSLADHVTLEFDVTAVLSDLSDQRDQQMQSMKSDLHDSRVVDDLADKLKKLKGFLFGWYREDYQYYRGYVSNFVNDIVLETKEKIWNLDFHGLRGRFVVINRIQKKLGGHLNSRNDPNDIVKSAFAGRIKTALEDMEACLEHSNIDHFQTMFVQLHHLASDLPPVDTATEMKMSKDSFFLDDFDVECRTFQENVHSLLLRLCNEFLQSYFESLRSRSFDQAADWAHKLIEIGYFLCTTFESYREEVCTRNQSTSLSKLVALINSQFGALTFRQIGRSVAVLGLSRSAKPTEVKKAKQKLIRRWHPDRNPDNQELAKVKSQRIIEAYELLSDESKLDFFAKYDFVFLVASLSQIQKTLKAAVNDALERNEFHAAASICARLGDIEAITILVKDTERLKDVEESFSRAGFAEVKNRANALQIDIQKALASQDFVKLDHSFVALEALEAAFKRYSEVVPESVTSKLREHMLQNIEEIMESSKFLLGKDERYAFEKMDEFGNCLVKIGRFLDGFSRLKKETAAIMNSLLNKVQDEAWGVSFLFKLGLRLENGDLSGDDDDKRVGRVITSSFKHFADVQNLVTKRRFVTVDEAESIKETKTIHCNDSIEFNEVSLDRNTLKTEYEKYETMFNKFFVEFVGDGHDELVLRVFGMVEELGSVELTNWTDAVKTKLTEIIAGVFATFTMIKSGDTFTRFTGEKCGGSEGEREEVSNPMDLLFQPHNIQIIALLRLLGIGSSESVLQNQIMEIRTGEGKSLILGSLSVVLALLGFTMRCVCYSQHLSERDNDLFRDVFVAFKVENRIVYSKITAMSEDAVAEQGDIRQLTLDLIRGGPLMTEAPKVRDGSSMDEEHLSASTEMEESGFKVLPSAAHDKGWVSGTSTAIELSSGTNRGGHVDGEGPLPLNGKDILLVDEVDVFFGPDFYGQTYNQLAELQDPLVEKLLRKVWAHRKEKISFRQVKSWSEYSDLKTKYGKWSELLDSEVRSMCRDMEAFNDPPYEVDTVNSRIGYTIRDSVDWDVVYGYRTSFAYLHEHEKRKLKGSTAEENIRKALCLRLSCGQFSYARITPSRILGVSATLAELTKEEKQIVKDFGVDYYTFVPSVYGPKNLDWTGEENGTGIQIEKQKSRYLQTIAKQIDEALTDGRAAIAFFKDDERLNEFKRSKYWKNFRYANVLASATKKDDRIHFIKKAATSNQVTISTAAFGRGTDFFCVDGKLEKNGGLLVIQTFLSVERSEEIQIKGRTARQGQRGSYSMVLLESDLESDFEIMPGQCAMKDKTEIYGFLDKSREEIHSRSLKSTNEALLEANERDRESRKYLSALVRGERRAAATSLMRIYKNVQKAGRKLNFCRMICLSDATGSMSPLWSSTLSCIHEMLRRIDEIGEGQFELMWVAYRDYCDSKLLEKSSWSKDPSELAAFISKIKCSGGGDYEEAVEWALKEANEENEHEPITRVLLIADAPPHFETKGQSMSKHNRVMPTDYVTEAKKLKAAEVPVYAFRVRDCQSIKKPFDRIASITEGASEYLDLGSGDGAKKLIDTVCMTALEDIGGSELLAEYRAKY